MLLSASPSHPMQCSYVLDTETNIPWTPSIELRLPVSIKAKDNTVVREEGQVCPRVCVHE